MDTEQSEGTSQLLDKVAALCATDLLRPEDRSVGLSQILEALPAAVYTTDAEGRLTFFNRAAVELSGRRPRLGSDRWCVTWRLFHPDGSPLPHDECPMAVALKEGRPVRGVEAILERPDGTRVHFQPYPTPLYDAAGRLVGGVNMLVDITDRKRAEQALERLNRLLERRVDERTQAAAEAVAQLRQTEQRFRILVQGVVDYAIFMLDPEGIVSSWNAGAERIKGYRAEEIVGRHFSTFYTEPDRQRGVPDNALATARRTGKYEAEGWRLRKDGTTFWAGVVIDAIRDEAGELIGFAKVTRDLTEKRAAEEQLLLAQKMESIGQLTGGVAHDFNNLLTAVIGNLEMLALRLEDPNRRLAEAALRAAMRGARLTEQLLAYARRHEIRPEPVNISRLLRETLLLCQKTVGEGIELVARLRDDLWTCQIDPTQFEAAVLNLASNARDAMDRAGQLIVATENRTVRAGEVTGLAPGEYVVLEMTDTGCGMSPEVLARVFEPFYTTKEIGKGTGLGLSQVYGFAKQSGGAAHIDSHQGGGTTVRLYLPRIEGQPIAATASLPDGSPAETGSGTILVAEDDVDVRETIVQVLTGLGYRVLVAGTAVAALGLLRSGRPVDLLFTDVVMPGGTNGLDLARAARRLRPDLKILVGSGHAGETIHQIRDEFPFIAKPHRSAALARKIRELLAAEPPSPARDAAD
jgi:PAS domain S-box-containing protein